jgi:hypothetical protein
MTIAARSILTASVVALAVLLSMTTRPPAAYGQAAHIRWDLVHFTSFSPPIFEAGGFASAHADDNSTITLTGSGTFVAPAGGGGASSTARGGGMWDTFDASGVSTGTGTYQVTGLVRWEEAPGSIPAGVTDLIDPAVDAHSGLVFLRIEYSDGEHGVLVVDCHLAVGTPNTVFEGITASKGFVDYWSRVAPVPNVDGNRTVFHTVR